jgi:ABC-type branched-subunit amino acid transport system ATPase component
MNPSATEQPGRARAGQEAEPLLDARGLSAGYGALAAVRDLNLHVRPGEIVAVLGANGAGKTTTLLTLAGEIQPMAGEVRWLGEPCGFPLFRRARQGLALVTEERSVFMALTARENLRLGRGEIERAVELFPELSNHLDRVAGLLSGGQQQMLTLARALAGRPRVLLADELSLGLAPLVVQRLLAAVQAAARDGVGVILVEQHVRQALKVADRVYVLQRGRVVFEADAATASAKIGQIEKAYLEGVTTDDASCAEPQSGPPPAAHRRRSSRRGVSTCEP